MAFLVSFFFFIVTMHSHSLTTLITHMTTVLTSQLTHALNSNQLMLANSLTFTSYVYIQLQSQQSRPDQTRPEQQQHQHQQQQKQFTASQPHRKSRVTVHLFLMTPLPQIRYLLIYYHPRRGGPFPEVLQYRVNPWRSRSKLLHLLPVPKISLISMSPDGGRIRY